MRASQCSRVAANLRQLQRRLERLEDGDFAGALGIYPRRTLAEEKQENTLLAPSYYKEGARGWSF